MSDTLVITMLPGVSKPLQTPLMVPGPIFDIIKARSIILARR